MLYRVLASRPIALSEWPNKIDKEKKDYSNIFPEKNATRLKTAKWFTSIHNMSFYFIFLVKFWVKTQLVDLKKMNKIGMKVSMPLYRNQECHKLRKFQFNFFVIKEAINPSVDVGADCVASVGVGNSNRRLSIPSMIRNF